MITTTIQDAWLRKIDASGHEVYLYRDGGTVLYVGRSTVPLERLRAHLTPSNGGDIGKFIREHLPSSLQWEIDLFNLEECEALAKQHLPDEYTSLKKKNKHITWIYDLAERALIIHHRPSLNTIHNPDKIILPQLYLNATQAAKQLGVSEKTVRRWIDRGELEATHVAKNRYAIAPTEVARVAEDMKQPGSLDQDALISRVDTLESRIEELERKVERLASAPTTKMLKPPRIPYQAEAPAPGGNLPAGYVPIVDLIKRYHAPETSVMRYFRSYEEGKHLHQGNWKASDGRTIKLALDQEGQAEFMRQFVAQE